MSVTIEIENGREWAKQHNFVERVEEPCGDMCSKLDDCVFCSGTGIYVEEIYPFEMNLSNANFFRFMRGLGFKEPEYAGELDGRVLIKRLQGLMPEKVVRKSVKETGVNGATLITGALSEDLVALFVQRLSSICEEAQRREELVIWG